MLKAKDLKVGDYIYQTDKNNVTYGVLRVNRVYLTYIRAANITQKTEQGLSDDLSLSTCVLASLAKTRLWKVLNE